MTSKTKIWSSIDGGILKGLPNAAQGYEQRISIPEFTFLGVQNQPDFGNITLWFYGKDSTIELKSLKQYLFQYRDTVISYERCIDVMYKDLIKAYAPDRIRIEIEFRPRGGISSRMTVDSDWGHLGGTDQQWQHHKN
jgi:7-cyano-7-deazaguanine reductase